MTVYLRAMDGFVAASGPAGPLRETRRMIGIANKNASSGSLLLKVTLQTQGRVPLI